MGHTHHRQTVLVTAGPHKHCIYTSYLKHYYRPDLCHCSNRLPAFYSAQDTHTMECPSCIPYVFGVSNTPSAVLPDSLLTCRNLRCTTISALKLWDFQRIQNAKEPYYESVTLSIWSMAEVAIGIIVANLPPLRKSFDNILRHVLPSTGSNNIRFSLATYHSQSLRPKGDGESDKAMLHDIELH
jgi:hypothetical protein